MACPFSTPKCQGFRQLTTTEKLSGKIVCEKCKKAAQPGPFVPTKLDKNPTFKTEPVQAGGGRICFRGDSRPPSEMFTKGFFTREEVQTDTVAQTRHQLFMAIPIEKHHEPYYRAGGFDTGGSESILDQFGQHGAITKTGQRKGLSFNDDSRDRFALTKITKDIIPSTAVCVTPRFAMAVVFPPKVSSGDDTPEDSWVYAVYAREFFNTHKDQCLKGMEVLQKELAVRKEIAKEWIYKPLTEGSGVLDTLAEYGALWPLYAQELSAKSIPKEDIICACKVKRVWNSTVSPVWSFGCKYTLDKQSLCFNGLFKLDGIPDAVKEFFKNEPATGQTPSRSSGFYKDDEKFRNSIDTETVHKKPVQKLDI